jgi:hypothetical protein
MLTSRVYDSGPPGAHLEGSTAPSTPWSQRDSQRQRSQPVTAPLATGQHSAIKLSGPRAFQPIRTLNGRSSDLAVVEAAVVLAQPVPDAARPVSVVECAVVRQPTKVVDQAQQIGPRMARARVVEKWWTRRWLLSRAFVEGPPWR